MNSSVLSNENDEDDEDHDEMKYADEFRSRSRSRSSSSSRSSSNRDSNWRRVNHDDNSGDEFEPSLKMKITPASAPTTRNETRKNFISDVDVMEKLLTPSTVVERIPSGLKENIYFFVRSKEDDKGRFQHADDCGVWDSKATTVNSVFVRGQDSKLKYVICRNGEYCIKKRTNKKIHYEPIQPKPAPENIIRLHRYYSTLKRCKEYKRRVSQISGSDIALVEYIGTYPEHTSPHGNAIYQDTPFTRTHPAVMENIATTLTKENNVPRRTYKTMLLNQSTEAPRDFKQVRNIKQQQKTHQKSNPGKSANLADEVLEVISMVDTCDFVQQVCKSKGKMPNFVCFTEEQKNDFNFFLSQKSGFPVGVDRTFNLGPFYVTALIYKNLRVVRSDDPSNHPLTMGPLFLHKDVDFKAYNYFFSSVKGALCESVHSFELSLGKDVLIGSDEEAALTKAIDSNFPASLRFLCSIHLKDNTNAYMQKHVGIPQKQRKAITEMLFGDDGLANADSSFSFKQKSTDILGNISKYPKLSKYFTKRLQPNIESYVNTPNKSTPHSGLWTNNNCESLNHIIKMDAEWKSMRTPELINMLHSITMLHFKDVRRALYGSGNYRLAGAFKGYRIKRECWITFDEDKKCKVFEDFLKNTKKIRYRNKQLNSQTVKSTYCDLFVPKGKLAKKPGQKTRTKASKTKGKFSG